MHRFLEGGHSPASARRRLSPDHATLNRSQNASLTVIGPPAERVLSRSTRYFCFLHTWPLFHPHAKGAHCAIAMPVRMTATPSHCTRLMGSCSTESETARSAGSSDAARTVDKLAGRCGVPRPKKRTGSASELDPKCAVNPYSWTDNVLLLL